MNRCALALAVLLSCSLPAGSVRASALHKELGAFAQKIKALLDEQKREGIAVGEFTGPAGLGSTSGPGIQQALIEQLRALKVTVSKRADISVKGEYLTVPDERDKKDERDRVLLRLMAVVRNSRGEKLVELKGDIASNEDIARVMGATASLQHMTNADAGDRNESLRRQLVKPAVHLAGTRVQARKGSAYAVEVLVDGKPRRPVVKDGRAFVPLARGEVYSLRVSNGNKKHEAAVSVTIDGLDVFTFSADRRPDGQPRYRYFMVRPYRAVPIVGWHRTNRLADSFRVVPLAESALAKRSGTAGLLEKGSAAGTITVCFHLAWQGATPPEEKGARDVGPDATGFGPPRTTKFRPVQRQVGVLREAITIHYRLR
jgi:hypothetical protein